MTPRTKSVLYPNDAKSAALTAPTTKVEPAKNGASKSPPPKLTPAHYAFPVFFMCPPVYADTAVKNNPTMHEYEEPIDRDKFMAQWYNLYNVTAANSLVYVIPPKRGLQDMVYVNSLCYLPHIQDRDIVVLANFTGEGRPGEEDEADMLLKQLGYTTIQSPFKFEAEAECKFIRDNIYIGGYGFRTDPRTYDWMEKTFGARIIRLKETDPVLYHLDCSVFPIGQHNVLMCTEIIDSATIHEIEKVANVIPISRQEAHQGAANSLEIGDAIYNGSDLPYMSKDDPDYIKERDKNEHLERICRNLGKELVYFSLGEAEKSGGKLSCMFSHGNFHGHP